MNYYSFFLLNLFVLASLISLEEELSEYSYPKYTKNENFIKIAIVGINDIHGILKPTTHLSKPKGMKSIRVGGLTLFSNYLKILHEEWKENLILLDGGDQYQGSLESNLFQGEPLINFFNYIHNSSIPVASAMVTMISILVIIK